MDYKAVAKSLRWLANMFPMVVGADNDADRMSCCIHKYASEGAAAIEELLSKVEGEK